MNPLARKQAVEIRIANVGCAAKLDAIGAALEAVREAHKHEMSNNCWAALHRAQKEIAEAIMSSPS